MTAALHHQGLRPLLFLNSGKAVRWDWQFLGGLTNDRVASCPREVVLSPFRALSRSHFSLLGFYTLYLQLAITTPGGGSWGYSYSKISNDNSLSPGKVVYTTRVYVPYSFWTVEKLWGGTDSFSSLSEKIRKSNRCANVITKAALSSQLLKDLSVGPAGY